MKLVTCTLQIDSVKVTVRHLKDKKGTINYYWGNFNGLLLVSTGRHSYLLHSVIELIETDGLIVG